MGTNYYARIRPPQEKVEELKRKIDLDHIGGIKSLVHELYGERSEYEDGMIIHLGKRSCGWKFLWNPNVKKKSAGWYDYDKKEWIDKWEYDYVYPLTKQGISDFLHREDVFIFSEYYCPEETQQDAEDTPSADEFLEMAFSWGKEDGWDAKKYHEDRPEERVLPCPEKDKFWRELGYETQYGHDFYSDGLRFSTSIEFS